MKVKFVTDSREPNVALMKLKQWCNIRGHEAGFNVRDPNYIIVSCIWQKNRNKLLDGHRWMYPEAQVIAGGPGYDPSVCMPLEIERMKPDYSLYPGFNDSVGFVTAGCFRKCPFCVVPAMRPLHYVQHVREFYRDGICRILDDNILAMPGAFKETAQWLIENDIETRFEYLDIRLVNKEIAELLKEIPQNRAGLYFAYDITNEGTEKAIKRNVQIFRDLGFKKQQLVFLIYIRSMEKSDLQDALHRWDFIRSLNCDVFGMCNSERSFDYKFKRRVMRPALWRGMTPGKVFGVVG